MSPLSIFEQLCREELALLQSFVQSGSCCACLYDAAGRCRFVNDELCRWLGRRREEIINRRPGELWPPGRAAREEEELQLVLAGGALAREELQASALGE